MPADVLTEEQIAIIRKRCSEPEIVVCKIHDSKRNLCYVQPTGAHVPVSACLCGAYYHPHCPVTEHRNRYRLENKDRLLHSPIVKLLRRRSRFK